MERSKYLWLFEKGKHMGHINVDAKGPINNILLCLSSILFLSFLKFPENI